MYGRVGTVGGAAAGGTGLAFTGVGVVGLIPAAVALLGAGLALLRLIPRREG